MKKYVIIKKYDDGGDEMWESYRYGLFFKIFGRWHPNRLSVSFQNADDCVSRLIKHLSAKGKPIEIIKVLEL